jgi:hypothetical protein
MKLLISLFLSGHLLALCPPDVNQVRLGLKGKVLALQSPSAGKVIVLEWSGGQWRNTAERGYLANDGLILVHDVGCKDDAVEIKAHRMLLVANSSRETFTPLRLEDKVLVELQGIDTPLEPLLSTLFIPQAQLRSRLAGYFRSVRREKDFAEKGEPVGLLDGDRQVFVLHPSSPVKPPIKFSKSKQPDLQASQLWRLKQLQDRRQRPTPNLEMYVFVNERGVPEFFDLETEHDSDMEMAIVRQIARTQFKPGEKDGRPVVVRLEIKSYVF